MNFFSGLHIILAVEFYLNIKTGTPSLALRGRWLYALEQDIKLNKTNQLTLLGEYHRLQDASDEDLPDSLDFLNYPRGFWLGSGIQSKYNNAQYAGRLLQ